MPNQKDRILVYLADLTHTGVRVATEAAYRNNAFRPDQEH